MSLLKKLFQRRAIKREIDEELRFHIEQRKAENLAAGMSPEAAAREAHKRFGNVQSVREECRVTRGASFGEGMALDVRLACRRLVKNPGFTAVAVLTLALGIGANTAMFSVIHSVLLKPLPYPDADRLVRIDSVNPQLGLTDSRSSDLNIVDWQDRSTTLQEIAAFQEWDGAVTIAGESESVQVDWLTPNLLPMLGIRPVAGRLLRQTDPDAGVMLPYAIWQRRFAGKSTAIGQPIKSDGDPVAIVGILPPNASVPMQGTPVPDQTFLATDIRRTNFPRDLRLREVVARLKPGFTIAQAQDEMNRIAGELEREHPDTNRGWGVKVTGLKAWQTQAVRAPLLALDAATGILLLIACLNTSNLLLIRGELRSRETAVRAALGASRLRLLRQPLIESLLISFAGAALGLVAATGGQHCLLRWAPDSYGLPPGADLSTPVLFFALGTTIFAAVFSALLPSLRFGLGHLGQVLGETGRAASQARDRRRLLNGLVAGQIAISTMLLAAAALTLASFQKLMRVDPGFACNHTLSFRIDPYPKPEVASRVLTALSSVPGVQSVGGANIELLHDIFSDGVRLTSDIGPDGAVAETLTADYWRVTTDYFSTVGIPLVAGRWFDDHDLTDVSGGHLVIINEALARRLFPGRNAVGQSIRLLPREGRSLPREIIGVVGSIKHHGLSEDDLPIFYVHAQDTPVLAVRTAGDPLSFLPAIRAAVQGAAPELIMSRVATTQQIVQRSLRGSQFATLLLSSLAALGAVLAAVGLYGVMSYAVSRRRQEIGIRMAVGAQRGDVLQLIIRQGMSLVLLGLGSGLALAVMFAWIFRGLLFQVSPADPLPLVAISALLGCVALLACWLPAHRATRIDPIEALRHE
jgi:predicted permease